MKISGLALRVALLALATATPILSQGTTTGGIGGTVTGAQNAPVEGAQVTITDRSTGFVANARTRSNGSYLVQGLEVGGPYSVSVRQLGNEPQAKDGIRVTLSQITRVDFQLTAQATVLAGVTSTGERSGALIAPSRTGIGTTITDTMVSRLPSLNRDFVDFARLTPQIAVVPGSGISGGGTNNRFNSIQIDGVSESDLFGIGSTGTPGGGVSAKSISVESVKEYQVLLSPFDVRQGNFVGALINAVTKSGTNSMNGSAYGYMRDQQMTRTQDYLSAFNQKQFGFSLGGPILKDKVFFFVNPEFQQQTQPTPGPFVGSVDATVTQAQIDAFNTSLARYGISGGTGDIIPQENPLTNIFGRLDFNLPWSSRARISLNYSDGERTNFSRGTSDFRLTSNAYDFASKKYSTVGQVFTNWSNGSSNELSVGYVTIDDFRSVPQISPQISVLVPRVGGGAAVSMVAGTERSSQGNALYQTILDVGDNFTIPVGAHNITLGTKSFFYFSDNLFAQDRYGTWNFSSLDSLNGTCTLCAGSPLAQSYSVRVPIGEQARAKFNSATYGFFIQDQWKVRPTMNLLAGLRADIPVFKDKPPFNQAFFTEYDTLTGVRAIGGGRRTDEIPSGNIEWSPRVGFNWDVTGDERNQFRAGAGVFSGPPAYVWLSNAFGNSGVSGYPALTCNSATNAALRPPAFTQATVDSPPQQCAGPTGSTAALGSAINLLNKDLHFPQTAKFTAGFDHRFSGTGMLGDFLREMVGTVEAQYSKGLYTPFYKNLALIEPDATVATNFNSQGRLMYGTLAATGSNTTPNRRTTRAEVYDVTNSKGDYSYQLTGGLTKRYETRWEGALFYTYTVARDIQSTGNSTAGSNFGLGRILSGGSLLDMNEVAPSRWEIPHRLVAHGTYTFPFKTAITAIWTGNSGQPFTYYHTTDENADGQANDAIYVPTDVRDVAQIRFQNNGATTIAMQQDAFDAFIEGVPCLDAQRGKIMRRNSCRGPWQNVVDISVRQPFRTVRGQNVSVQLDVFNFANLLNDRWGIIREAGDPGFPGQRLLSRVASTTTAGISTPTYNLASLTQPFYTFRNIQSNYRMQLSMRYSF